MNWFKRHLNWTWMLGLMFANLLWVVVLSIFLLIDPYGLAFSDVFLDGLRGLIVFLVMLFVSLWVIDKKGRRPEWVLLAWLLSPLWLLKKGDRLIDVINIRKGNKF
ncbi:MAG: hypothetical protein V1771_05935 [Chloroflexota bacterium]